MPWKSDTIEQMGSALIQHGHNNDRVYLMKLLDTSTDSLISDINALAAEKGYTKLFAKIPASAAEDFIQDGFVTEAKAPGLFNLKEDCLFMGKFISLQRKHEKQEAQYKQVLDLARQSVGSRKDRHLKPGFAVRKCTEEDAAKMSRIYASVYSSYPFPIDSESFIINTMRNNTHFYRIEHNGAIIALASMEVDKDSQSVEMTDFATLEQFRGEGLASLLLMRLEHEASVLEMKTSFTIARSISPGMNIVFANMGYAYCGRLVNNTQISGQIESMNVWSKELPAAS